MRNKRTSDYSFTELVSRFEDNFKEILRDPTNIDPYLNILNDSTYNAVKFVFDPIIREEAKANFNKRKQAYLNAGITEDDLYNQGLYLFR